jgi:hypothetical protein
LRVLEMPTGGARFDVATHHGEVLRIVFATHSPLGVTAHADGTVLLWHAHRMGRSATTPGPLSAAQLEALWADLGSDDARAAHAAIDRLLGRPGQAFPLLKQRLSLEPPSTAFLLQQWLAELDSPSFKVREAAVKHITKVGKFAEPALRRFLESGPSLESARRVELLLGMLTKREDGWDPAALRAARAVEVLERLGTAEARFLLAALARQTPESWASREARVVLERLR